LNFRVKGEGEKKKKNFILRGKKGGKKKGKARARRAAEGPCKPARTIAGHPNKGRKEKEKSYKEREKELANYIVKDALTNGGGHLGGGSALSKS